MNLHNNTLMPSTPLEKIEADSQETNTTDDVRVQRILQEINGTTSEPPGEQQEVQQHQQQQQQMANYHMYPPVPQRQMVQAQGSYQGPEYMQQGQEQEQEEQWHAQQKQQQQQQEQPLLKKKNVWAHITDAFKLPFVVACVFFILSLPIVDMYLSKYAHWAFSSGGQLSISGLLLKAVFAGAVMGIYDWLDTLISRFF